MPKLKDVHWFSYHDNIDRLNSLTLWQAIIYVLRHTKGLPDEEYRPYIEELNKLEEYSANDIVEGSDNSKIDPNVQFQFVGANGIGHYEVSDKKGKNESSLEHLSIPSAELDDELELLEFNRKNLTEQFAIPNLLYTILSSEVERAALGLPLMIQLPKKQIGNRWPLIRRTSLKAWQKAHSVSALRLQQAGKASQLKRKTADLTERLYLTIGLMGRLLKNPDQALGRRIAQGTISIDALSKLIHDRATNDHIECASVRTLTSYFNEGERACINQTRADHFK